MIEIIWTPEKKDRAIKKLTEYFEQYGSGESIMQGDNACIYAPVLLSEISDDILIEGEGIIYTPD